MNDEYYSLKGKVVIVSGASSGIGEQISISLAKKQCQLIMIARNLEKLEKSEIIVTNLSKSTSIESFCCDISDKKSVNKSVKEIESKYGEVFGLINNAAVNPSRENIIGTNESDWDQTITTNLSGTYHLTKEIIPLMVKKNEGSIINISSIAGITGMKERFSYSVSKSGLIGFTKSIATDFAEHNIRVNTICPGYIKTPLTEKFLKSLPKKEYLELERKHPLMGFGKEEYITDVVDFLLSNKSAWITGSTIPVDGGYSLGRD